MTSISPWPVAGPPVRPPEYAKKSQEDGKNLSTPQPAKVVDNNSDASIWRDTALRYGGYADEVGEFLSPYLGGLGKFLGYLISTLYCISDMSTSIPKKYMNAPEGMSTGQKTKKTAAEGADLSAFHLFATLLIPPKIIGSVVQSVERALNREALEEARTELEKEADALKQSGGWKKKLSYNFSKAKFTGEEALGNLFGDRMDKIIEKAADTRFMASAEKNANKLIEKFGLSASKFVSANAWLAQKYDDFMKFEAFKDPHMPKQLRDNAKALKNPGSHFLSRTDVTKLILMKPWPVLVGIGMVPLIAHPFDKMWLNVQDWTIRPIIGKNKLVRDANGKLKSIHNPEFWGPPKAASPTSGNLSARNPGQVGQSVAHPAFTQGHQPLPYQEFGAVYTPLRPTVAAAPMPFTQLPSRPFSPIWANRPFAPITSVPAQQYPAIIPAGATSQS